MSRCGDYCDESIHLEQRINHVILGRYEKWNIIMRSITNESRSTSLLELNASDFKALLSGLYLIITFEASSHYYKQIRIHVQRDSERKQGNSYSSQKRRRYTIRKKDSVTSCYKENKWQDSAPYHHLFDSKD